MTEVWGAVLTLQHLFLFIDQVTKKQLGSFDFQVTVLAIMLACCLIRCMKRPPLGAQARSSIYFTIFLQ
uniref:Uncharacterized protein n=1 Tax=mine drainage metagenome TaxID=410659 RepID=E6QXA1_9ZZZZ